MSQWLATKRDYKFHTIHRYSCELKSGVIRPIAANEGLKLMQNLYFFSFKRIFSTVLLVLLALGCSKVIATGGAKPLAMTSSNLEILYGFSTTEDKVSFVVTSNGCTKAEHFELDWNKQRDNAYHLTLVRTKKDRCRAMPRAYPIEFPTEQRIDDQTTIIVSNPFGVKANSTKRL